MHLIQGIVEFKEQTTPSDVRHQKYDKPDYIDLGTWGWWNLHIVSGKDWNRVCGSIAHLLRSFCTKKSLLSNVNIYWSAFGGWGNSFSLVFEKLLPSVFQIQPWKNGAYFKKKKENKTKPVFSDVYSQNHKRMIRAYICCGLHAVIFGWIQWSNHSITHFKKNDFSAHSLLLHTHTHTHPQR